MIPSKWESSRNVTNLFLSLKLRCGQTAPTQKYRMSITAKETDDKLK